MEHVTRKMCGFWNLSPALVSELRASENVMTEDDGRMNLGYSWVFNESLPLKSASEGWSHESVRTQKRSQHEGLVLYWKLDLFPSVQLLSSLLCSHLQVSCLASVSSLPFLPLPYQRVLSGARNRPSSEAGTWCSFISPLHVILLNLSFPLFPCLPSGCSSFIFG